MFALTALVTMTTGLVGLAAPAQAAIGNILPPFPIGETWSIYQGYGPNAYSHNNDPGNPPSLYGLDLTYGGTTSSSTGKAIHAPVGGFVYGNPSTSGTGTMCINMPDGRSVALTHINSSITGGSVTAGQFVGTVAAPGQRGNGGVAHLHFQIWSGQGCWATGNGGMPFDSAHNARICGAPDLMASGPSSGNGVWSGTSFTDASCGAASASSSSVTGDNKADIIWYEQWNNGGQAKVIATNSSGSGPASGNVWFSGYAKPDWAGTGDFNGDGKTDLAWYESWNNGTLKVLFSNGTSYSSSIVWFSGFGKPKWAGVGDFTGDGKDDIAWYEDWNNGGTLKVIPTNAAGNGANASITWFSGFSAPDWADIGDLTGDGKDDIAWYEGWNNGSLKVIVTNSSGTGSASGNTWFSGYGAPTWAAIGNFSGDGKEDIAWYEDWNSGGKVTILPSNGAGTNPGISWFSGYAKPDRAFAADFTGDGRDDIAWYEGWNNGTLKVIPTKTDGTGTGTPITWFSGYGAPTWAAAG